MSSTSKMVFLSIPFKTDSFFNDFTGDSFDNKTLVYEQIGVTISNIMPKKFFFYLGKGDMGKTLLANLEEAILGSENAMTINNISDLKKIIALLKQNPRDFVFVKR